MKTERLRGGSHCVVIMRRLARAQGRIVTKNALLHEMYRGTAGNAGDETGVLRATICYMRKSLPAGAIRTHPREGYSLDAAVGAAWLAQRESGAARP